jgi:hypothetical protein
VSVNAWAPAIISAATVAVAISSPIAVTATVVTSATVVASAVVATAKPRTGADEDPTAEPSRTVVAVRGAIIRSVSVVAIGTGRRRAVTIAAAVSVSAAIPISGISRTANSNTDCHSLRVRITCANQSNR